MALILGPGRSPGGGHGSPLQCSCLEDPIDRGAWQAMVHRDAKSLTQLKWLSTAQYICQLYSVSFFICKHFPMLFQTLLEHHFHSHTGVPEEGWWPSSLRWSPTVEQLGWFWFSPLRKCCRASFCATGFCCISSASLGHIPRSRVTGSKRKEFFFFFFF